MTIRILDLNDKKTWHAYLNRLKSKDVYFTPEYCEIYEKNGEGKAQLFLYEEGEDFVFYPYLLRNLNDLSSVSHVIEKYGELYDITTPYGYGGPVTNVEDGTTLQPFMRRFTNAFKKYCYSANIISEFIRFHPLLQNQVNYLGIEKAYLRDTIQIDLLPDYETIWANYDTKNRNRIRKSKTYDLRIVHRSEDELSHFLKLYYSTMEKAKARDYYFFSEDFFRNTIHLLKEKIELIEVITKNDQVIMTSLFIYGNDYIHYHLSGSDRNHLKLAANNLILDYAVKWAKEEGFKSLHLGGGYSGNDDSLYRFKKHFNRNGNLPFHIGKQIHNPMIYGEISSLIKDDFQDALQDYFPIYRHPDWHRPLSDKEAIEC
ncbi:peptidoglycan bridge formation glycyltransferase FemA/FemB family protein [Bacillus hwajinpoensis]|uniref:Lipid II:glycine glycyltransferase n=1 Tax=Guptibacillus hwajinpoensis TaxID=208199 RepID=A0A845ERZ9_9BACL|nr:GNAT family N-acetyltransferase [Pseudalkalibacillus hwajinpoensis]MYL62207.1 peptidoglycan bridge formation glycyltransferase FemA/FemB family protein [Pseudalkalibacillus hwajinpoensis]